MEEQQLNARGGVLVRPTTSRFLKGNRNAAGGVHGTTKLKEWMLDPATCLDVYLKGCEDKYTRRKKSESPTGTTYELGVSVKIPTLEGFALFLGISKLALRQWSEAIPEIQAQVEKLKLIQAQRLIEKGLSGEYTPQITRVLLNYHGYYDKENIEITGKGGGPIEVLVEERKRKIYEIARMYDADVEELPEGHDQEGSY